ncbi:MAG TPA: hypothetical protein VGE76_07620 [Opitutaceae bacterium]
MNTPMHRREFLLSSAATASLALLPAASRAGEPDELLSALIRAHDEAIPKVLATQERRPGHPWYGGIAAEHGFYTVAAANGFVGALAAAACASGSKYYRSKDLVEPLRLAIRAMRQGQHADGTVDYYATNFHSPPDLAFILEGTCPACALLRASPEPALAALAEELKGFIAPAAEALVTGGVHTPNHRWVVCAALAWVNRLYPDKRYVDRIDQWLAEGIDIDPDGQYTERSTTVYSPIVDRALITVARLLDRPALYEPVRRNLEMSLYYVHPDGEVVTEASRRQDRGVRASMARYYYSYRTLALRDGNRRFAAMARQIEREAAPRHPGELTVWLTEPEFGRPLPPEAPLPTDYEKVFSHSGLARIRRGAASGTLLAGSPIFFSLRKGAAALEAVRFASAFFGKGQFAGDALVVRDGRYVLRQALEGPYYQPLTKDQIAHGDHVRMTPNGTLSPEAKALRKQSNIQKLESTVTIAEEQGRFTLVFSLRGTAHVPVAVELGFRRGGTLEGVREVAGLKEAYLLEAGAGKYRFGGDVIEFGPGRAEHTYTQVRGALPKWDGLSVYLTGVTPFEFTLKLS